VGFTGEEYLPPFSLPLYPARMKRFFERLQAAFRSVKQMEPIERIAPELCRDLKVLFCDFDGTLTTSGKLTADAYCALWDTHLAGIKVVLVTGRPAGWADHMARMWPLDGVIGENGALIFRYAGGVMHRRFAYGPQEAERMRKKLFQIAESVLREFPGCAVAADQPFRRFDVAIDFAEDVGPFPLEVARKIKELFENQGAKAKISSIHVNAWFGDFDKLSGVKLYLDKELDMDLRSAARQILFVGDSPNDEPLFGFLPYSVAVAGLRRFTGLMKALPAYITSADGGAGFAEAVRVILSKRRSA